MRRKSRLHRRRRCILLMTLPGCLAQSPESRQIDSAGFVGRLSAARWPRLVSSLLNGQTGVRIEIGRVIGDMAHMARREKSGDDCKVLCSIPS